MKIVNGEDFDQFGFNVTLLLNASPDNWYCSRFPNRNGVALTTINGSVGDDANIAGEIEEREKGDDQPLYPHQTLDLSPRDSTSKSTVGIAIEKLLNAQRDEHTK
ncbi:hypothetical protein W02_17710 [Nitrospira sp. KM1]|nr:hypothetical protein W02_17710 [Nitrospira sp. KM1]